MITSEVAIYNLALNAIGARNNVEITSERSREAEVCRLWYSVVRDQVLAAAPWPAAKAFRRLALKKARDESLAWDTGDPEPGYAYVYSVPDDILRPLYLADFSPFTMSTYIGDISVINTNTTNAILYYIKRLTQVSLWDSQMQMAVVYGMAANICNPITGKTSRTAALLEQANTLIIAARETAANVDNVMYDSIPDWLRARGYEGGGLPNTLQFFYPHGALLSVANVS